MGLSWGLGSKVNVSVLKRHSSSGALRRMFHRGLAALDGQHMLCPFSMHQKRGVDPDADLSLSRS